MKIFIAVTAIKSTESVDKFEKAGISMKGIFLSSLRSSYDAFEFSSQRNAMNGAHLKHPVRSKIYPLNEIKLRQAKLYQLFKKNTLRVHSWWANCRCCCLKMPPVNKGNVQTTELDIVSKSLPYLSQEKCSIWTWAYSTAEKSFFPQCYLGKSVLLVYITLGKLCYPSASLLSFSLQM